MTLAIFSAAKKSYVYEVIDKVLLPRLTSDFYFDAIYTQDDLDSGGVKRMDEMFERHQVSEVMLVDDCDNQCLYGALLRGANVIHVPSWKSDDCDAHKDTILLEILKNKFFEPPDIQWSL